ncbi:unnamed protein product, partial [Onchocerca ochengi]|uniref:P4Hc domain-containing protein n=1 Tax=Onchocerca ochengi TaxID=42157 RepID=A0A182EV76_ONCOC
YKMDRPYLRLAPFKVEIVRQNPLIVLFYDIVSDEEARIIQTLGVPKARAYLKSTEHEIVKRVDKRLELATNLEIGTAEDLQEGNKRFEKLGIGNRLASAMTEPEIGGRTVFTVNLKISVPCIKNAALFWYNLMRNGEIDARSLHAACPVLTGIKWIVTKWIHERGQEWRRPCGLNQFD